MRGHLLAPDENGALARGRKKGDLFARHHVPCCWIEATDAGDETILAHPHPFFFAMAALTFFLHLAHANQGPENPKGKKTLFIKKEGKKVTHERVQEPLRKRRGHGSLSLWFFKQLSLFLHGWRCTLAPATRVSGKQVSGRRNGTPVDDTDGWSSS